jgi:glycosyltransferase involved in cell wall biosynthesis
MIEVPFKGRVAVVGAWPNSLVNFRGELLRRLVESQATVFALAAQADPETRLKIEDLGVQFESFQVQRNRISLTADARTFFDLRSKLRAIRPDVLLCYTIKPVIWGGLAYGFTKNCRFVALITGLGFAFQGVTMKRRILTRLVIWLYRRALKNADAVVFQNEDNRQEFVSRGIIPGSKAHVINGSGVNLDHFDVAPFPSGPITFLLVARLLGDKGVREYVRAASIVRTQFPKSRFLVVGWQDPSPDGITQSELQQWVDANLIELLGFQQDVRPSYAQCHVFVLPSYHEGMPRTVLEAMAAGRPIITTNIPGCRATVVENENGFLVAPKDALALADKMIWFAQQSSETIQRMGSVSRRLAESKFDVHEVNRQLLGILLPSSISPNSPREQLPAVESVKEE